MKRILALGIALSTSTVAISQDTDVAPLDFRVKVGADCDTSVDTLELGAIGVAIAQIGIKSVVGLAGTLLAEAGREKTLVRSGWAAGSLFQATGKAWQPSQNNCLVFWYGRTSDASLENAPKTSFPTDLDSPLVDRWTQIGLVEAPFAYGEVRIIHSSDSTAIRFEPVRLYVRTSPEFESGWGRKPTYAIAIDLTALGQSQSFASHVVGFPGVLSRPIMANSVSLNGKGSGWFTRPTPSTATPPAGALATGHFTAKVVLTATAPGSKLASALSAALSEEKPNLLESLKPKTDAEREAAQVGLRNGAFDAVILVETQQQLLEANSDPKKKNELELKVRKAQYAADVALEASGLPRRYFVSGP